MSHNHHSVRLPEWLDEKVTEWLDLHDTTFSRLVRKALEKFLMTDDRKKHSDHVRCDLVEYADQIIIKPNPDGKYLVSRSADQQTLREMYERGLRG